MTEEPRAGEQPPDFMYITPMDADSPDGRAIQRILALPPMPKYAEADIPPGLFANSSKFRIQGNAVCNQCGKEWWPTKGVPKRCRWCKKRTWAK